LLVLALRDQGAGVTADSLCTQPAPEVLAKSVLLNSSWVR
jgi:hypothetical protein